MKKTLLFILTLMLLQTALFAQQAPDFTETDCNGVEHHLYDELAAGNAIIINFCAGWCYPCRLADPVLEEIYQTYCQGNGKVKVYGMLFEDYQHQITDCDFGQEYAAEFGLTFPLFTNIGSWNFGLTGEYADALGLWGIPTFYIIIPNMADPANSQVITLVGYSETLEEDIEAVLAEYNFGPGISAIGDFCTNPPYSVMLRSNHSSGITWSTGETTQDITVNTSGTYTLTRNMGGCDITVSKAVEFLPVPVAGTASVSSNTVCSFGKITLDYTPGTADDEYWEILFPGDLAWRSYVPAQYGPIDMIIDNYIPIGSVLRFRVRAANGISNNASCISYSNVIEVTVNDDPPGVVEGTASASSNSVCFGSEYTLNYSGNEPGAMWQFYHEPLDIWFDIAPADQGPAPAYIMQYSSVNGGPGDKYRVKAFVGNCYNLSDVVEVYYYYENAEGTASASSNLVCAGAEFTLSFSGSNYDNAEWEIYYAYNDAWHSLGYADQDGSLTTNAVYTGSIVNGRVGGKFRLKAYDGFCYVVSNVVEVAYSGPVVNMIATPENNTYTGGIPTNIYLGYGPQSVTLDADVIECTNFNIKHWAGPFLSCNDCENPVFAPTEPGDYKIVVYIYDENGFWYTTRSIKFCVRDVRVPGQNNKVYLCHDNNSLAVAKESVPGHLLNHGDDALGNCGEGCVQELRPGGATERSISADAVGSGMQVFPNPAQDEITVSFHAETEASYTLKIVNATGQTVLSAGSDAVEGDNTYRLSMKNLPSGMYFVALQSGETLMQQMVVKE